MDKFDPPPPYPDSPYNLDVLPPHEGLVSVDFNPNCIEPGGFFTNAEFENFPTVLQRANAWLAENPAWEIRTCETVEYSMHSNGEIINESSSSYVVHGQRSNRYVRGLRLWLQPSMSSSPKAQQIGYYNIMPQVTVGFFRTEAAERLDTLLAMANQLFSGNPIQGTIITVETVALVLRSSSGVDPDCTSWSETGNDTYVYMLRIFYNHGPPSFEMIGVADFIPATLKEATLFGRPDFERFPQVLAKAHRWVFQQPPQQRVLNIQTLQYREKWSTTVDTLKMTYNEHSLHSYYVRYLRVAFVYASPHYPGGQAALPLPIRLNCKMFTPGMLEPPACCTVASFEDQAQVRERINQWLSATGARVISVETVPMRIFSGAESLEGFDTMYTWNSVTSHHTGSGSSRTTHSSKATESYVILYRVYIDGVYPGPAGIEQAGVDIEDYMRESANQCTIL